MITNPTIIDDGREQHQLSTEDLTADTQTLLKTVLNSEYIRIARRSASLLSSYAEPLVVHYNYFNGYAELLNRSDLETTLLSYIDTATTYEKETLLEMLQRFDMQEILSESALVRLENLCVFSELDTYAIGTGANWVDWGDAYGITLTGKSTVYFSSGESINAYRTTREYKESEWKEKDAYYAAQGLPITLILHADISYNCHSYAWYQMDSLNPFWIGPGDFGQENYESKDDMFIPSTATRLNGNYQVNDIVVYYSALGKILHSAVIVEISGNTIIVQSKWGKAGVYRHAVDTVPPEYTNGTGGVTRVVYRYHHVIRTITDLGHNLNHHRYNYKDICRVCSQTISNNTVNVECSGPPCASPFSLQHIDYNEVNLCNG